MCVWTPNSAHASAAGFNVAQSESLPITIATVGGVCPLMLSFGFAVSELDFRRSTLRALQCLLQRCAEHGQMPHFAQWPACRFSIDMNMRAGNVQRLLNAHRRPEPF